VDEKVTVHDIVFGTKLISALMIRIFKPLAEPWSLGVPPCFGVKSYIDAHSVNGYMKKAEALGTSAQTTFKNKVTFFALS
jgi:hypothetical protein